MARYCPVMILCTWCGDAQPVEIVTSHDENGFSAQPVLKEAEARRRCCHHRSTTVVVDVETTVTVDNSPFDR